MATFTKAQLKQIIKEEYEAVMNEDDSPFGERTYDHSLVSGVSKAIEWRIDQAFTFVLDLLEDVNASDEYREVRKVLERASQSDLYQASQEPVSESKETSRMITKLEKIGKELIQVDHMVTDPAVTERLEMIDQMVTELWEEMHNLLDSKKKPSGDWDHHYGGLQETLKEAPVPFD